MSVSIPAVGTLSRPPFTLTALLQYLCVHALCFYLQSSTDPLSPLSTENVYDLSLLNPGSQRLFVTLFS